MRWALLLWVVCSSQPLAQVDSASMTEEAREWESLYGDEGWEETDIDTDPPEGSSLKVDLNSASLEDLERIPGLGIPAAYAILQKRHTLGGFDSLSQAFRVRGMSRAGRAGLRLYGVVGPKYSMAVLFSRFRVDLRSRFQQEDQPRSGFSQGAWPGSRARWLQRLHMEWGKEWQATVLTEKDPGESSLTDHVSGYVAWNPEVLPIRILCGDFHLSTGEGLVFARSSGFGKTTIPRSEVLLRPAATATEGGAFRGLAVEGHYKEWTAVGMYSWSRSDATWDSARGVVTSVDLSGLHRTEREMERADILEERSLGGVLRYSRPIPGGLIRATGSILAVQYSRTLDPRTPFGFRGTSARLVGFSLSIIQSGWSLSGECARDAEGAPAWITSLAVMPSEVLTARILVRDYTPVFASPHGMAYAERSGDIANERGAALVVEWLPLNVVRLGLRWDQFQFPQRTWLLPLPSSGWDAGMTAEWDARKELRITLRGIRECRDETMTIEDESGRELRPITQRSRWSARIGATWRATTTWSLTLRADLAWCTWTRGGAAERGTAIHAHLRFTPWKNCLADLSITRFQSASYDSRLSQYETDLPGVMRIVALAGAGSRSSVQFRQSLMGALSISFKYAWFRYDDRNLIGEGEDAVIGNRLGILSVQLDLRL